MYDSFFDYMHSRNLGYTYTNTVIKKGAKKARYGFPRVIAAMTVTSILSFLCTAATP